MTKVQRPESTVEGNNVFPLAGYKNTYHTEFHDGLIALLYASNEDLKNYHIKGEVHVHTYI